MATSVIREHNEDDSGFWLKLRGGRAQAELGQHCEFQHGWNLQEESMDRDTWKVSWRRCGSTKAMHTHHSGVPYNFSSTRT